MCLDRSGLHKECVDFCNKWFERFPDNIELQRTKAETIIDGFCIGRKKDGIPLVERSSLDFFETIVDEKDKRKVSDFCYLARLYEWVGKIDEAISLLDEAAITAPNYWEIPFNRASFQWRLNELEDSLANALKATQIAPWRTQTWRLLARIYSSLNLEEKAEEAINKAEYVEIKREELFDITGEA
jgi:tetratricopeptide (TPR) repeat protein